jgi:hypothetical protein
MIITGDSVPLDEVRANNVGDWRVLPGGIHVKMASVLSDDEALLVFLHELVEARLCQKAGVTDEQVTEWDEAHLDAEEPGEVGGAPYRVQHSRAIEIEKHLAEILGVDWVAYEARLHALFK